MCYKLVDDETGAIINLFVIRSATESGTANLCVDPIEPLPPDPDDVLDEMMSAADFGLSNVDPVDSIPSSTKSKTWQKMEHDNYVEYQEDAQQRYFKSEQPTLKTSRKHRYPTRSKTLESEATTVPDEKETLTTEATTAPEQQEFVFLRDKGEKSAPIFKQCEFILREKLGEPRLDHEEKEIIVIGPSPDDITGGVFLTKPDERGNMSRARVVELINEFDNNLDKDPIRCKFKIEFEKNTPAGKDIFLDGIMSYNHNLDYVERETNNEGGDH